MEILDIFYHCLVRELGLYNDEALGLLAFFLLCVPPLEDQHS